MPVRIAAPAISASPSFAGRSAARARAVFALAGLAVAAAGCGASTPQFAPPAPSVQLRPDAADMTVFDGRGQDVTDMVLNARMTNIKGSVAPGPNSSQVAGKIQVSMNLTRGPALSGRTVTVPYVVAVVDGGQVIDEQNYAVTTSFPPNVDQASITDEEIPLLFPVTAQKTAAAYTVYIFFRLTPDQLAYNRAHPAPR